MSCNVEAEKNTHTQQKHSPVTLEKLKLINREKAIAYIDSLNRFTRDETKHILFN